MRVRKDQHLPMSDRAHEALASLVNSDRWSNITADLKLSPRERQIVECILLGVDSELLIADRLDISRSTVHAHVERLYARLHVTNRTHLVLRLFAAYIAHSDAGGGDK